jgi:hypothetical protein
VDAPTPPDAADRPYEAPTHLDVDDKIGPLPLGRALYLVGGAVAGLAVLNYAPGLAGADALLKAAVFAAVALPFALCALWRPLGYDPLRAALAAGRYAATPREAVWRPTTYAPPVGTDAAPPARRETDW